MKVFLTTQAKVEDIVQIELHKSPSGLLAGLLGRWLVGHEKKSNTKSPYYAGCKGFPALFLALCLRDSSSAQWSISIDLQQL